MSTSLDNQLTRIAVFYDGNYFAHVSNFYTYHHSRNQRISVSGLHQFIRHKVAQDEGVELRYCQIVESHYFRGRLSADDAQSKNVLYHERVFDHILMNEGVVTHYLPIGPSGEKGIDVWLALEAFELAVFKRFNVVVLVACDGDYVPLARKLNALGVRVMVLGWDFEIETADGKPRKTVTSQRLLGEVTYPVMMSSLIDDKTQSKDPVVNGIFVTPRERPARAVELPRALPTEADTTPRTGTIKALKQGYGFIKQEDSSGDCFFYWSDVVDFEFNDLQEGMTVNYRLEQNERGLVAKDVNVAA